MIFKPPNLVTIFIEFFFRYIKYHKIKPLEVNYDVIYERYPRRILKSFMTSDLSSYKIKKYFSYSYHIWYEYNGVINNQEK